MNTLPSPNDENGFNRSAVVKDNVNCRSRLMIQYVKLFLGSIWATFAVSHLSFKHEFKTMTEIRNPVLPGFNPDPSICRVEDDFTLQPQYSNGSGVQIIILVTLYIGT